MRGARHVPRGPLQRLSGPRRSALQRAPAPPPLLEPRPGTAVLACSVGSDASPIRRHAMRRRLERYVDVRLTARGGLAMLSLVPQVLGAIRNVKVDPKS